MRNRPLPKLVLYLSFIKPLTAISRSAIISIFFSLLVSRCVVAGCVVAESVAVARRRKMSLGG
jgi:hypothetical protein